MRSASWPNCEQANICPATNPDGLNEALEPDPLPFANVPNADALRDRLAEVVPPSIILSQEDQIDEEPPPTEQLRCQRMARFFLTHFRAVDALLDLFDLDPERDGADESVCRPAAFACGRVSLCMHR